jgi:alkanesulfonate monooxygenase SsuD/methylene tetrahydromethanopterin reductase-like flavin-dependent oxidoreductase (luciferase family)
MFNANRFKLGLFALNCRGGNSLTKGPKRWEASWRNNLTAVRQAEEAGLEFVLPLARWRGHGGSKDTEGRSLETVSWASGLLAATSEICVFATVHAPLVSPVFFAKQAVTADLIGEGRFGLNLVAGWNEGDFAMFGVPFLEHDERYAYAEEWYTIVKRIWTEQQAFDFKGKFFDLKAVIGIPKPWENERPLVISAGSSGTGRAFAARNADCLFMLIVDPDKLADELTAIRAAQPERKVDIYASGHVICRPTQKEAEEYYRYVVYEMGDWDEVDNYIAMRKTGHSIPHDKLQFMKERFISGHGTLGIVGSPDHVAGMFKKLSDAGLNGMAFALIDYINDFPVIRDEVLPRMERLGLREKNRN